MTRKESMSEYRPKPWKWIVDWPGDPITPARMALVEPLAGCKDQAYILNVTTQGVLQVVDSKAEKMVPLTKDNYYAKLIADAWQLPALREQRDELLAACKAAEPLLHAPEANNSAWARKHREAIWLIRDAIAKAGGKLLRKIELFDVYRGAQIPAGEKSLAYRLTYQAMDRTLTDDEVNRLQLRIQRKLETELGAALRG